MRLSVVSGNSGKSRIDSMQFQKKRAIACSIIFRAGIIGGVRLILAYRFQLLWKLWGWLYHFCLVVCLAFGIQGVIGRPLSSLKWHFALRQSDFDCAGGEVSIIGGTLIYCCFHKVQFSVFLWKTVLSFYLLTWGVVFDAKSHVYQNIGVFRRLYFVQSTGFFSCERQKTVLNCCFCRFVPRCCRSNYRVEAGRWYLLVGGCVFGFVNC